MMKKRAPQMEDWVGLLAVLAIVGFAVWSGVFHASRTTRRLQELQEEMRDARGALRSSEAALRRQQTELTTLEKNLARRGALPHQSPVETDLRTLTTLAEKNQVQLDRVTPKAEKTYPGITESKYEVEANTSFTGLIGFLHAFETSPFWADITELEVGQPHNQSPNDDALRKTRFVVSLFSSNDPEGAAPPAAP